MAVTTTLVRLYGRIETAQVVPQDPLSDDELISNAVAGDVRSFGELMDHHSAPVFTFALSKLGDRREAEEATQDTFLRAHRALGTWRGEASFRTWLLAICRNQCNDRLRRKREETVPLEQVAESSSAHDPIAAAIDRLTIKDAVQTLSDDEREAFVLVDVIGMTAEQAARTCDVPPTTLKSRLYRAHDKLIGQMRGGEFQ